jgi:glycosidase
MPGTPFIYQGDEIGMTNFMLHSVAESKDIETLTGWREAQKRGMSETDFLEIANRQGRDNARTPFQWEATHKGSFTDGSPWMPVNPNTSTINQQSQEHDPDSILNYVRNMISVRKRNPVLVFGAYEPLPISADQVFGFIRKSETEILLVLLNFSADNTILELPFSLASAQKVIGNYSVPSSTLLRPWEAIVYNLNINNVD